jgi:uncharacterized protein YbcI
VSTEKTLPEGASATGPVAAAISTAVVGFCRDHFGRGPTKARTYVEDDVVGCVLRDASTVQDRELQQSGHGEIAREARKLIRQERASELAGIVEGILGRRVACTLGDFQPPARPGGARERGLPVL